MTTNCPECRARFRAPRAGLIVPCPECGNPVAVAAEAPDRRAGSSADARQAPASARRGNDASPRIPWPLVGAIVAVLFVAHYGLYLLITVDARAGVSDLVDEHGLAVTASHKNPGSTQPPANSPAYKIWRGEHSIYVASRAWQDHEAHRSLVAHGLWISLLIQLTITAYAVFRMHLKILAHAARRTRERAAAERTA